MGNEIISLEHHRGATGGKDAIFLLVNKNVLLFPYSYLLHSITVSLCLPATSLADLSELRPLEASFFATSCASRTVAWEKTRTERDSVLRTQLRNVCFSSGRTYMGGDLTRTSIPDFFLKAVGFESFDELMIGRKHIVKGKEPTFSFWCVL